MTARPDAIAAPLFTLPSEELASDTVDVAIGFFPEVVAGTHMAQTTLGEDRLVAIAWRGSHRSRALSMAAFARAPQVRVNLGRAGPGLVDDALGAAGIKRRVALTVPGLAIVPRVVARSDLIGVVPKRLADAFAPALRLRVYELPFDAPPLRFGLAWHERNQDHPAHVWLRREIVDANRATAPAASARRRSARPG